MQWCLSAGFLNSLNGLITAMAVIIRSISLRHLSSPRAGCRWMKSGLKEQAGLLKEKEEENKKLYDQVRALSEKLTAEKEKNKEERHFNPGSHF